MRRNSIRDKSRQMRRIVLFNKPYDVLSQFTDKGTQAGSRRTLSDFVKIPGVYPAGRLDRDSEGLLVLTDDGKLQAQISNPRFGKKKTYWVQVEGLPDAAALKALCDGVVLKDGKTKPAEARLMGPPDGLWRRDPPIRERKSVADCWLELTLSEGRNRQVRRMTAAVGHPTLRLIRSRVADWDLGGLQPGEYREIRLPGNPMPKGRPTRRAPGL